MVCANIQLFDIYLFFVINFITLRLSSCSVHYVTQSWEARSHFWSNIIVVVSMMKECSNKLIIDGPIFLISLNEKLFWMILSGIYEILISYKMKKGTHVVVLKSEKEGKPTGLFHQGMARKILSHTCLGQQKKIKNVFA